MLCRLLPDICSIYVNLVPGVRTEGKLVIVVKIHTRIGNDL